MKDRIEDLKMPEGLSPQGQKAYEVIIETLKLWENPGTGGCKAFYAPADWQAQGNKYGAGSELVIVYDGGDLQYFFSMDSCYSMAMPGTNCYELYEKMQKALGEVGLYFEECTGYYSAIYRKEPIK